MSYLEISVPGWSFLIASAPVRRYRRKTKTGLGEGSWGVHAAGGRVVERSARVAVGRARGRRLPASSMCHGMAGVVAELAPAALSTHNAEAHERAGLGGTAGSVSLRHQPGDVGAPDGRRRRRSPAGASAQYLRWRHQFSSAPL